MLKYFLVNVKKCKTFCLEFCRKGVARFRKGDTFYYGIEFEI